MPFADPATVDALNAEVVALIEREGYTGQEAIEAVLFRHRMRLDDDAGGDVERWRMQNGRCVIVRWATPFGHVRTVTSRRDWERIAAGFDTEERWPDVERAALTDVDHALHCNAD